MFRCIVLFFLLVQFSFGQNTFLYKNLYIDMSKKDLRKEIKDNREKYSFLDLENDNLWKVDFSETFVFYVDRELNETAAEKIAELAFGSKDANWDFIISEFENAMFLNGLDVGDYEFKEIEKGSSNNALKSGNLIVNGRYLFEFDKAIEKYVKIAVKDTEDNNKTVATIMFNNNVNITTKALNQTILIEHILEEFVKSGN